MSIKGTAVSAIETTLANLPWKMLRRRDVYFLPVLHVERLNIDRHFHDLLTYCREYKALTGHRVVNTVVTPLSPFMVPTRLGTFSAAAYSDRIAELAEVSIIGQHGHYIRAQTKTVESILPMNNSWFDLSAISSQLRAERDWLLDRGHMSRDLMIYSAGWWFMNDQLRQLLIDEGFQYDFSISQNRFCLSYSGWKTVRQNHYLGQPVKLDDSPELKGAMALTSTSLMNRPAANLRRLVTDCGLSLLGKGEPLYFTFYGHDYDLNVKDAIAAIEVLKSRDFAFFEPGDLP